MEPVTTGVIIRLLPNKGYGFIRGDDNEGNRFFHAAWCEPIGDFDTMREGMAVTFVPCRDGQRNNGLQAKNVRAVR